MKQCKVCGETKQLDQFPKNGVDSTGALRHRPDCKVCYNISRKLTKQKAVTKFLNNTKKRTGEVGTYTLKDWKDAMIFFKGCCAYCGRPQTRSIKLTRDHIIPVKLGGDTTRANIAPACRSCNSSKGDSNYRVWIKNAAALKRVKEWVEQ